MGGSLVNFIFLLCLSISLVLGDGMIEVFKWKQIDYYNRGGAGGNNGNGNGLGNGNGNFYPQTSSIKRPRPGADVIYPNDSYRFSKRQTEKITSRNALPSTATRFNADAPRNTSTYIPYHNVPMGVTHFRGRMFITMPRRRPGIPSTLNVIHMARDGNKESPKLNAYPNYEINHLNPETLRPNPNGLVSVYRTSVDDCQRLWFIDTGMLEYPGNRMQIQRPSIWIIDLKTDRILQRFEIPQSIVNEGRGLASITVDVKPNQCQNTYAYIPDLVYNRLYVYSLQQNHIWSFSHNYFNFDPLAGDLNVAGQTFRWDDGIFAITLGPRDRAYYRPAFFHAMASNNEFVVSTQVLLNETNAARSEHGDDFRLMGSRGVNKQSTMHEYDPRTGVIFYNEIQQNGIGCWNSKKPFGPETHGSVFRDAERMIYPSDLTIDEAGDIYVMSNTMPRFIYSTLDTNEYNFRVWKQNVFEAKRNTVCE